MFVVNSCVWWLLDVILVEVAQVLHLQIQQDNPVQHTFEQNLQEQLTNENSESSLLHLLTSRHNALHAHVFG